MEPLAMAIEPTPFVVPTVVEELEVDRKAMDGLWKLSWWDEVTLFADDVRMKTKLVIDFGLPLLSLFVGIKMSIPKRIAGGLVSLVVALLAHFGFDLPVEVVAAIDVVALIAVGYFIPSGTTPVKE